ncbi:hypothetical protein [Duganella callida]|uniref:SCP2 domain-containing protein n=1 Tax=Duganella callida TaxID=2561932 RepID=A0A4Y9SQF4_9BURK|nr:hypothetical protein [Duganella callida]TFW26533.1 hypothetical protein E4L98_08525 [Duganella callida]
MTTPDKIPHGTAAWFEMVGQVMMQAALDARLTADINVSLVEHYTDGDQGLRFEIRNGEPSYTASVDKDERGDITVAVTAAASRQLNTRYSDDPEYGSLMAHLADIGELSVTGDLSRLGSWFAVVHDRIVDRTR